MSVVVNVSNKTCSIGSYIKKLNNETLTKEFKEFMLLKIYSINYKRLIEYNTWFQFNGLYKYSFDYYVNKYLPKYLTSFINNKNINNGKLYIGLADDGMITGIPMWGDINIIKQDVSKILKDTIIKTLNYQELKINAEQINYILQNSSVEIIKLTNSDYIDDDIDDYINKYNIELKNHLSRKKHYDMQRKKWYNCITKYSLSLNELVNIKEVRLELIQLIKDNNGSINLIKLLETGEKIVINKKNIYVTKEDKARVEYWLCYLQLIRKKEYYENRPKKKTKVVYPPLIYDQLTSDMKISAKRMMKHGIKFMVVRITIPGGNIFKLVDNKYFRWYCNNKKKYRITIRQHKYNKDPQCIDLIDY